MGNIPDKQEKFSQTPEWRKTGSRHNFSAVFLLLVLASCLFSAQLLVWAHSDTLKSQKNGQQIIKKVSRYGLVNYIGDKAFTRYYLFKEKGHLAGYAAWYAKPVKMRDGSLAFAISELQVDIARQGNFSYNFIVANDMSWFKYSQSSLNDQLNIVTDLTRIWYKNGKLILPDLSGSHREIAPDKIGLVNMVPLPLVDLFSSITLDMADSNGAAFMVLGLRQKNGKMILMPKRFIVRKASAVPAEMVKRFGSARAVMVEWPGEVINTAGKILKQEIIYDRQNRLLWQNDIPLDQEKITVSRAELLRIYPEAKVRLYEWLKSMTNNSLIN